MSDMSYITPPQIPNVVQITTTAIAATQVGTVLPGDYKFYSDEDVWVKFGDSSVAAPVITAVSGDTRCRILIRGIEYLFRIEKGTDYFRAITSAPIGTTYLRWELEAAR